jgi:hypothetical protein
VDDAGGLRRLGAAGDGPGARLLWAGSQKGDQVEERIADAFTANRPGATTLEARTDTANQISSWP